MEKLAIVGALSRHSMGADTAQSVISALPDRAIGVLLYGSYARGDFTPDSDVDLLLLRSRPAGTVQSGRISVSTYTPAQLTSAARTLFGMHLARDGAILHDTQGQLRSILTRMGKPVPQEVFGRIRHLAAILDVPEQDENKYTAGLTRVARYLLRTAIYVAAIEQGEPCFSVRELAVRLNDPDLVTVLSANPAVSVPPSVDSLSGLRRRLKDVVGPLATNSHGALRNLVIAEWYEDSDRATLGTLALTRDDAGLFDYAALPKVLL